MKINIVSFYFPPEKGAAAQRIWNMVIALKAAGHEVTVLCPHPNYPTGKIFKGFGGKPIATQNMEGFSVRRHSLYPSNSKKGAVRLFSMLSFSLMLFLSLPFLAGKKSEIFIVNSPPLFTGAAGVLLSKILRCKLVLNISDLWPKSALELEAVKPGRIYDLLSALEYWMYIKADLILTQSEESRDYIHNLVPSKSFFVYRNLPSSNNYVPSIKDRNPLKIVYAGLLGVAQGVFDLIKQIDFKSLGVELHIYGDGPEKEKITSYVLSNNQCNIFYRGFVSVPELEKVLPDYHASLIPLKSSIYGAFPSKIFTAMKFGLPVLFCGTGEGKRFVEAYKIGFTNEPKDFASLSTNIVKLKKMNVKEYLAICMRERDLIQREFCVEVQTRNFISLLNNLNQESVI